jgi:hypothetical protein
MKRGALLFSTICLQLGCVMPSVAAGQSDNYTISATLEANGVRSRYVLRKVGQRLFESQANTRSGQMYLVNQMTAANAPGVLSSKMSAGARSNSMSGSFSSEVSDNSIVLRQNWTYPGSAPTSPQETRISFNRASGTCEISLRADQAFSAHSTSCRFQAN